MNPKPFAWSFSTLKAYELCPKKYYFEKVVKTHKEGTTATGDWGLAAHKAIEQRTLRNTPLPLGMTHYEATVASVIQSPGRTYGEQKMAVNRNYKPTDWFASDVWFRAIADIAKHNGKGFVLVDWKFGKYTDDWKDQGLVMANAALCSLPEVETVGVGFVWFAGGNPPPVSLQTYTRDTIWQPWSEILPRVDRMEEAHARVDYPARQNYLCSKYCPVIECPHNGNSRKPKSQFVAAA